MQDSSDWWSRNRNADEADEDVNVEKRILANSNFRILGIDLGETMFVRAAAKLGKATRVERGDASTGRQQVCYSSPDSHDKVHLIFEKGEVGYVFYLFSDGPIWEGADRCVVSSRISRDLATAKSLRLGITPAQVIATLGKPTRRHENELIYAFSIRKKTDPKGLKEARARNPGMSEKDLQENFGHYDLVIGIVAKFVNSKLTYLAVSKVETA